MDLISTTPRDLLSRFEKLPTNTLVAVFNELLRSLRLELHLAASSPGPSPYLKHSLRKLFRILATATASKRLLNIATLVQFSDFGAIGSMQPDTSQYLHRLEFWRAGAPRLLHYCERCHSHWLRGGYHSDESAWGIYVISYLSFGIACPGSRGRSSFKRRWMGPFRDRVSDISHLCRHERLWKSWLEAGSW